MNERQKRFVDEYIQTGNASEAARRAGYSRRTARYIGTELIAKPNILKAIDERLKELESQRVAKTQELLEHLTSVVRGEVEETIITNSGKVFTAPVAEKDRLKAAEMLLKVQGAFREKVDVKVDSTALFVETLEKIWSKENDRASPD